VHCIRSVRAASPVSFGAISYSLYLIHGPIGFTIASVLVRRIPEIPMFVTILLSLAACLVAALILYRAIELPSRRLAARVKY
jgi:peptidoglycan/LPS O-acetylase OafA/YrhL